MDLRLELQEWTDLDVAAFHVARNRARLTYRGLATKEGREDVQDAINKMGVRDATATLAEPAEALLVPGAMAKLGGAMKGVRAAAALDAVEAAPAVERAAAAAAAPESAAGAVLQETPGAAAAAGGDGFDMALGLAEHQATRSPLLLREFAEHVGAKTYKDIYGTWWPGSMEALQSNIAEALKNANRLHFNLDQMSLSSVQKFAQSPAFTAGNVTNWELVSILRDPSLLQKIRAWGRDCSSPCHHPIGSNMGVLQSDLTRFINWRARLWDFSPTHSRLVVRLFAPDDSEAFLVLSCCDEVSAPVFWLVTNPKVIELTEPYVELVDEGVRIRCQEVSLQSAYTRSP